VPDTARWTAGGAALLLLAGLLWTLLPILNPVLLWLALVGLLLPFRRGPVFVPVVTVTGVMVGFWLLYELGSLLAPFVVAVVAAYILNPLVHRLAESRVLARFGKDDRLPRTLAVTLLALPVVGGVVAAAVWGVPWVAAETSELVRRAPAALERLAGILQGLEERLGRLRLPGMEGSEVVARIQALNADDVVAFLEDRGQALGAWLLGSALGVGRGVGTALTVLGYLVLTPVVAFYLMRDWDRVVARAVELVPPGRPEILVFGREFDRALAGYLRGQVTVSVILGVITGVGLLVAGFPYALLLGLVVAIFNVVPYLGLVLSLLPAIGIALASGDVGASLLKVAVVYGAAQGLEGAWLGPRIVGDSTGLHPVWILLAIAVGGFFFGFVGLLLAVPAAVGLKLLLARGVDRYRTSEHFRAGAE
jgi:predicted PurR-regulated permease PerM